jgi:glycerol uptake facilitator-like aquaporin
MADFDLRRRLTAEAAGTAFLVAAVVGSGIMAEKLTQDVALQLLCNTLPTGAVLVVLITVLGPISGAHLNPAVSLVFAARGELSRSETIFYIAAQVAGGIAGTGIAHLMFSFPVLELSAKLRTGPGQWFAEAVATFGLIATILGGIRFQKTAIPWLVGLYITSAYWFTASTSFANPAVTLARALTRSFSGIAPVSVPLFIAAQVGGALLAGYLAGWLFQPPAAIREATGPRSVMPAE